MILKMYAVKDRAADAFGRPFFVATDGLAIRSFTDEVQRASPDNQLNLHADDFDLFCLADFDDNTGELSATGPRLLFLGKNALAMTKSSA